ncbi:Sugar transporter ESL1 [Linum perenne]
MCELSIIPLMRWAPCFFLPTIGSDPMAIGGFSTLIRVVLKPPLSTIERPGGMIGALFCGRITATFGRKYTMWLSQIFSTIGWLGIALAQNEWWLIMGRLSIGFGVGFVTYVVPVYLAEITPKEYRGAFSSANQLLVNCGFSLVYFAGNIVSWRTLALIALVPGALQLVGIYFIPESPRWLARAGRGKELKASLQQLRGKYADISEEEYEIQSSINETKMEQKARFVDIFQMKYAYALTVGVGLMFLQQLGGTSGVAYYGSSVIQKAGFSIAIGTIIISIIQVPVAAVGIFLMDICGRRLLLMVSAGGMSISSFLVALSFVLQGYFTAFSIGMGGVPWIIMSEIFPMNVKDVAGTLITLVNWSSSWVMTYSFNFMMQWSPAGTFFILAATCGATVVFTFKLVPETRGRTLEEIQASMTRIQ